MSEILISKKDDVLSAIDQSNQSINGARTKLQGLRIDFEKLRMAISYSETSGVDLGAFIRSECKNCLSEIDKLNRDDGKNVAALERISYHESSKEPQQNSLSHIFKKTAGNCNLLNQEIGDLKKKIHEIEARQRQLDLDFFGKGVVTYDSPNQNGGLIPEIKKIVFDFLNGQSNIIIPEIPSSLKVGEMPAEKKKILFFYQIPKK